MPQQRGRHTPAHANITDRLQVLTSGGEVVATGDLGVAGLTATQRVTLVVEAGSCSFVYAAVNWKTETHGEKVRKGREASPASWAH